MIDPATLGAEVVLHVDHDQRARRDPDERDRDDLGDEDKRRRQRVDRDEQREHQDERGGDLRERVRTRERRALLTSVRRAIEEAEGIAGVPVERVIAGVASGWADRWGIEPTVVRAALGRPAGRR